VSFLWRLEPGDTGVAIESTERTFSSQSDAESWIGENWRRLADAGVESVELLEDVTLLYTMSLSADS
jgi:hypothetical protein